MKKLTMIAGAILIAVVSAPAKAGPHDHQPGKHAHDRSTSLSADLAESKSLRGHEHYEQCDFKVDSDFSINNDRFTFDQTNGPKISIDHLNNLYVNGQQVSLNATQQVLVTDYADGIRNFIPEVANIAIDGVRIGVRAAEIALGHLFGEDDIVVQDINYKVAQLADKVIMRIDPYNFDSKTLEQTITKELEPEIEAVVQDAHAQLMPRLMAKGFTLFASGDETQVNEFEQRMKDMEQTLELEVEAMAAELEKRANGLCTNIEYLDNVETQMVNQGLDMMDIIKQGGSNLIINPNHFNFSISE